MCCSLHWEPTISAAEILSPMSWSFSTRTMAASLSSSSKYVRPLWHICVVPYNIEAHRNELLYISRIQFSHLYSFVCLQGALYCLLGNHSGVCLANLHDWECIALTWPAVVRSGLSSAMSLEKPSIVRLFDDLADKIHRQYETIGIDFSVRKTPRTQMEEDSCVRKSQYFNSLPLVCLLSVSQNLTKHSLLVGLVLNFIPCHIFSQIISYTIHFYLF